MNCEIIDTTPETLGTYGVCGYKNTAKQEELRKKIAWYDARYREGLRIKTLFSEDAGTQGMIEYVPGEYAWRPVLAEGYMFIHCIFVGFKKEFKGKGFAVRLLETCEKDARKAGMRGIAVLTRKSSFMAGKEFFLKHGFTVTGKAKPDFELLTNPFDKDRSLSEVGDGNPLPRFPDDLEMRAKEYGSGLTIIRADQCPYSVKNVRGIMKTAEEEFRLKPRLIELSSTAEAQNSPSPFGTFAVLYNGNLISYHPISNTRFRNIMTKLIS